MEYNSRDSNAQRLWLYALIAYVVVDPTSMRSRRNRLIVRNKPKHTCNNNKFIHGMLKKNKQKNIILLDQYQNPIGNSYRIWLCNTCHVKKKIWRSRYICVHYTVTMITILITCIHFKDTIGATISRRSKKGNNTLNTS